jgi:hypothetical protein
LSSRVGKNAAVKALGSKLLKSQQNQAAYESQPEYYSRQEQVQRTNTETSKADCDAHLSISDEAYLNIDFKKPRKLSSVASAPELSHKSQVVENGKGTRNKLHGHKRKRSSGCNSREKVPNSSKKMVVPGDNRSGMGYEER